LLQNPSIGSDAVFPYDRTYLRRFGTMPGTYKKIEVVGTSPVSFSDAVKSAVADASQTIRRLDWFEVVEQRGMIKNGKVAEYQVVLKLGFKVEQ
jgi:flavin-binding protein dodecin